MKRTLITKSPPLSLAAALLAALGVTSAALGATPALQGQVTLRPLTPQDIKDYTLTGAQGANGLATVGVGQPAYLDAMVNIAIPSSNIAQVTWVLTNQPLGSLATLAPSPLGSNVPLGKVADRTAFRLAGRTALVPDLVGQYSVIATITTTGWATNVTTNVSTTITAGTYMGVKTCSLCHSGGQVAENMVESWSHTAHATFFTRAVNGLENDHYGKNCISCHTVGYDANTNAVNGGFDDIAKQLGWTFPATLATTNWDAMPEALQNLSNIQCENCHGPGSQHAYSLGNTNFISKSMVVGDCSQCHDSKPNHVRPFEWSHSGHANATRTPSGANRNNCVRCHTAWGFEQYAEHLGNTNAYATNTVYEAITCQTCHDPHDASNPNQLRLGENYVLPDGTAVTNAGSGGFCMNCHHSRNGEANQNVANYQKGLPTWANGSSFGVHDSPQGDMLEGVNAITYGKTLPSGAHRSVVTNTCAGCHMQPVATTDPAFGQAGGHTFHMTYNVTNNGVLTTMDKVDVCVQCHGPIEEFNMAKGDYNGDGVIQGVQDEVQALLNKLSTLLPNTNGVIDGAVKTSLSVKTNWATKYLNGAYNWQFVNADGSKGIHNAPFAVALLKASISDLTGDANEDGLPDSWQVQYFGSANSPNAAPTAMPAGDGVPNWLKYSLGLDPTVPATVLPGGVVLANGKDLVNPPLDPSSTNGIAIYTAAEVTFNTEAGKTYQLQSVASMSGGWQNVGTPIPGTGSPVSYVTPTRYNVQQYYRVVATP